MTAAGKMLFFVSTGRCGTLRISQILRAALPKNFVIRHQMPGSALANIVGNIMLQTRPSRMIKRAIFRSVVLRHAAEGHFISTDPLTAMMIPEHLVRSADIGIVHVLRDHEAFAHSFLRWTRTRRRSWVAHNLVPFWQPGLWPLENAMNKNILGTYARISKMKNAWFTQQYSHNPFYRRMAMEDMFGSSLLERIIREFFEIDVTIDLRQLQEKSNQSNSDRRSAA